MTEAPAHAIDDALRGVSAAWLEMAVEDGLRIAELERELDASARSLVAQRQEIVRLDGALAALRGSIERLFPAIAHGDAAHRAWLSQAIEQHFAGETPKASKVSTTLQVRQPDRGSVKPAPVATNERPKEEPATLTARVRAHRVDLKGVKLGTFEGIEPTSDRRLNSVVWRFACTLCRAERLWSSNNVNAIRKRSHGSFKCVCQGGAPPSKNTTGRSYRGAGQPVRHIPVERQDDDGGGGGSASPDSDEDWSELGGGGEDLDDIRREVGFR